MNELLSSIATINIYKGVYDPCQIVTNISNDEPISTGYNPDGELVKKFVKYDTHKIERNHLCLFAIDTNINKIIALRNSVDLCDFSYDLNVKGIEPLVQLGRLTLDCYKKYFNYPDIKRGTILHFSGLYVAPEYRENKLGSTLIEKAVEIAKRDGFKFIVVEANSLYSYKIMCKFGFKLLEEWAYDSVEGFKDKIKPPHTHYKIMCLNLF